MFTNRPPPPPPPPPKKVKHKKANLESGGVNTKAKFTSDDSYDDGEPYVPHPRNCQHF